MIKEEMEGVYTLRVPLKVDMNKGRNWNEAH
jgi:DNA polymerase I-like protein with 3'-5' exonuclease and polymerase domains